MLMQMRLKKIQTDWPLVSARKQVSLSSPADNPTKQIAGRKTGGKRGPVILFPDLGTRVNPPFGYDSNHYSSDYAPLTLAWITPPSVR
ncbi:hypothetical protein O181_124136 [Austropuccinia psidii MF-1]|uniref:Uncharacterized protein n=1 Tax=Austropuccinia psidii MF-1 TaxID=1389203 RepID=A0A9Q3Q3W4_9BASI|nr:hypothetical protein [Austropuccinia psidii MF-1]